MDNLDWDNWNSYIFFLVEWAVSHKSPQFFKMCPPSFDEWFNNDSDIFGAND